jgi:hypothetical protein
MLLVEAFLKEVTASVGLKWSYLKWKTDQRGNWRVCLISVGWRYTEVGYHVTVVEDSASRRCRRAVVVAPRRRRDVVPSGAGVVPLPRSVFLDSVSSDCAMDYQADLDVSPPLPCPYMYAPPPVTKTIRLRYLTDVNKPLLSQPPFASCLAAPHLSRCWNSICRRQSSS